MLKSIFEWLDLHPGSYWVLAGAATLLLVARLIALIGRESGTLGASRHRPTWRDALVLFLFLLAWLWPFLLVSEDYNPDESQMIAGALTLAHDPSYWRAVDGGSSGPFNYYLLMPWAWLGAPLDYFTARLTGLLLVWGALFACLWTLARAFGCTVAWLGIMPTAAFFATVGHPELTNLSTEHLPLFMTALAFGLLAGRAPGERLRLWAACFVAGALPWTKLQSAPLGLVFIGWSLWQALGEQGASARSPWGQVAKGLLAAVMPTLLLALMAITTGQVESMVRRYFLQNILYVGHGSSVAEAMSAMWNNAQADGRFPLLLWSAAGGLLAATVYFVRHRIRPSGLLLAAGSITLAALAAVIAPRREYLHYALLLPVPLALCLGAALGGWWRHLQTARARLLLATLFLAIGLLPLATRGRQPVPAIYGRFGYHWRHPRSSAGVVLHALAGRGESLATWGWACYLHVESGLPQATPDGNSIWSIEANPQQDYYRGNYLATIREHAPALFVDAVGQGAFRYQNRSTQAHESFPELADYIRQNYTLVIDLLRARIYARKGSTALREMDVGRLRQMVALGRRSETLSITPPSVSLDGLQHKIVGQRQVVMLLPPARIEWWLDADVREVSLEFGYDPVAYEQGRSNGTELYLELIDSTGTRQLLHRFLDPARVPADRGPQSARVVLPPFAPGTMLVLRTDPGQYGDNAWDWVYLASLRLHRASDPEAK